MTQNLGAVLPRRKHDGEVVVALLQDRRLVVAGKLGDAADQQRYRLALLPGYDEMDYCNWLLRLEPPINSRHIRESITYYTSYTSELIAH